MRKPISRRAAEKMGERERATGLDHEDEAAKWLADHDPKPEVARPKSASKSKTLHRWRKQQQSGA